MVSFAAKFLARGAASEGRQGGSAALMVGESFQLISALRPQHVEPVPPADVLGSLAQRQLGFYISFNSTFARHPARRRHEFSSPTRCVP